MAAAQTDEEKALAQIGLDVHEVCILYTFDCAPSTIMFTPFHLAVWSVCFRFRP